MLYSMEAVARTQTAFRIKNGLLERLKWKAKKANKSLNSYVEDLIEEDVGHEGLDAYETVEMD